MKKIVLSFLCIILFAVNGFAAEIVFSPGIGFSVYTLHSLLEVSNPHDLNESKTSEKAVTYAMPAPSIGLDMHFIHEGNGFTFSLINNAGFPITLYKKGGFGNDKKRIAGFIWDAQMLFGYTYGIKKPFSIRFGIGTGFSAGVFKTSAQKTNTINPYYIIALPVFHLDIQYVFTKHFGVNAGIRDMLGFSGIILDDAALNPVEKGIKKSGSVGLGNVFALKLGAVIRF